MTNKTQTKIAEMLKTSTGASLLDSGGAYGRHWERNQERDFDKEPAHYLEICTSTKSIYKDGEKIGEKPVLVEIRVVHNVYHFLDYALTYNEKMDARYKAFCEGKDEYELVLMEEFVGQLECGCHGIYDEGDPFTVNTYNGEDCVSQTLQYLYFTYDGSPYVLLQIHQGCDVRGGYTNAVCFEVNEDTAIMDNAKATVYEEGSPERNWYTDDSYNYYYQGSTDGVNLNDWPFTTDPALKGDGVHIYIQDEKTAFGPSGGQLKAGF